MARRFCGQVVSVDSMQVYRGMDIGTAKVSPAIRAEIPHHLIDIRDPSDDMSVAEFQGEGRRVLERLGSEEDRPVLCGGSGLHFRSLVDPLRFPPSDPDVRSSIEQLPAQEARRRLLELDPKVGKHIDLANPRRVVRALEIALVAGLLPSERAGSEEAAAIREYRPVIPIVVIGLDPGEELATRIEQRFDRMLESGLLDEVASLRSRMGKLAAQAVGYKELIPVVDGAVGLADGRANAIRATRALAKRQRTFFRRDPRVRWVPWSADPGERIEAAIRLVGEGAT
jgi:tRNA dimethylallyltransferase